jgi:deazaflavin-dependent oxidoreductase (nitroreductase family)
MRNESREERAARRAALRETETFAAWGRRHVIVLRGRWGLAIDRVFVWLTGYSLVTKQYAIAGRQRYKRTFMLRTIGARTGKRRTVVIPYGRDRDRFVLVGSNGGGPTDPHWVHNIRAHPQAWVRLRWRWRPVQGYVASGEERERLWRRLAPPGSSYAHYQQRAAQEFSREIPVVVLSPVPAPAGRDPGNS